MDGLLISPGHVGLIGLAGMLSRPSWAHPLAVYADDYERGEYWRKQGSFLTPAQQLAVTRSSGIILPNSGGVYQPLGNNVLPRTDRGLYANGQVTNLLLRSQEFNDGFWNKANLTVAANAISAPDGTITADRLIESADGANTNHQISLGSSLSFTAGVTYTLSVFAKENGRTLRLGFPSAAFAGGPLAYFDLVSGTVLSGGPSAQIESFSNGWYRCSYRAEATSTVSNSFLTIAPASGSTRDYIGNGLSGIFVWGAQLETGSFAGPYTPTTTAAATLLASDIRAVQGTRPSNGQPEPFHGWEAAGLDDGFTFLIRHEGRFRGASNRRLAGINGSSGFTRIETASSGMQFRVVGNDGTNNGNLPNGDIAGAPMRSAFTMLSDGSVSLARSGVGTVNSGTIPYPVAPQTLSVGSTIGINPWNDWLYELQICPPLSDAELLAWVNA